MYQENTRDHISTEEDFAIQHPETKDDVEQYLELMRRVFGKNSGADTMVDKLIHKHPRMNLKNHFLVKHENEVVASLNLIPTAWSIGGIPLKVAEMGNVATLPEYRHRGLQKKLIERFHMEVSVQGYDLSVIEGIPYFYRQFGYEYAIPLLEETTVRINQIPDYESKHVIRLFKHSDVHNAMRLLTQTQGRFYVHAIRDENIWNMQEETGIASGHTFKGYAVEENGELAAYFRMGESPENPKQLFLREISEVDQSMARSILRFLKDMSEEHAYETLISQTSYHDIITEHIVAMGGLKRIPTYAWQIRATDYAKIFLKMKSLFDKRLAASTYRRLTEKLNFNFRRYTVQMRIENGAVVDVETLDVNDDRTIGLNLTAFIQLLVGHRSREELEAVYPDFVVRSSHKHLIDVMFPKLPSYIHSAY